MVRHLYTDVDRSFGRYLTRMHSLLDRAQEAGWVEELTRTPITTVEDLAGQLSPSAPGELVILDLHGHTNDDGAWIGPAPERPFFDLRQCPAGIWSAAAVVLSGCEGTQRPFQRELRRINSGPFTLAGHWETAQMWDHTAIDIVRTVLGEADGGDTYAACTAALAAIRDSGTTEKWMAETL